LSQILFLSFKPFFYFFSIFQPAHFILLSLIILVSLSQSFSYFHPNIVVEVIISSFFSLAKLFTFIFFQANLFISLPSFSLLDLSVFLYELFEAIFFFSNLN